MLCSVALMNWIARLAARTNGTKTPYRAIVKQGCRARFSSAPFSRQIQVQLCSASPTQSADCSLAGTLSSAASRSALPSQGTLRHLNVDQHFLEVIDVDPLQ
jgi:hypothetical protein